jgi:uncharacterized membrane protein
MMFRIRPAPLALLLIGIAGVAISIYLTTVHYAPVPLACPTGGIVNCERVLSSPYSVVAGIPISVGGILWFAVSGALGGLALFSAEEPPWLQPAQVIWSLVGLAMVLYLIGVEVLALGVMCAWCTSLHVLIVATLLISLFRSPEEPEVTAPAAIPRRAPR